MFSDLDPIPALCVAIALAAGMMTQVVSRHLRLPGLVLLLVVGVVLGPDGLNIVQPETLGSGLLAVVDFTVAVILFEGGMNLKLDRLRQLARPVYRLITIGALLSGLGGMLAVRFLLGWEWRESALFGAISIVTGPTVINPLMRRLRVKPSVSTVLEAEGVMIDAIGAILAMVALEIVLSPLHPAWGPVYLLIRLAGGVVFGLLGGALIVVVFRSRNVVPDGLENVVSLALAVLLFQVSNAFLPESGIAAVIVAGMVVSAMKPRLWRRLHDFKGQLTVMLLGLLFVLLAADVRLSEVFELGLPALAVVLICMLVIRPLAVFVSTMGSRLSWRERAFIAWVGPRGIVAAAIASLFATELARYGATNGADLRALMFMLIAVSVAVAGTTSGFIARRLGLKPRERRGWVILGANPLARLLAKQLERAGEEVICVDANPTNCRAAEEQGLHVIHGNALDEIVLERLAPQTRLGAIALTDNDSANFLFMERFAQRSSSAKLFVVLRHPDRSVTPAMMDELGVRLLGNGPIRVGAWNRRLQAGGVVAETWIYDRRKRRPSSVPPPSFDANPDGDLVLPLVARLEAEIIPFSRDDAEPGQRVTVLIRKTRYSQGVRRLQRQGFAKGAHRRARPAPRLSADYPRL